jgi:hypothetical protein
MKTSRAALPSCTLPVLALSALLAAACSSAPADATATSAEPLTGGSPSTLPVVQITTANSPYPCTGTLLSPSWVLTSEGCDASGGGAANVCLTQQGTCATGAPAVSTGGYYGTLVHLGTPLVAPSYATLSTTALGVPSSLTCASQSPAGPVQGSFTVSSVVNASVGLMLVTPGAATFDDMGDGCFEGGTLAALQGKLDYVEDLSLTSAAITRTMCGGATCGTVEDSGYPIACGACDPSAICVAGACACPSGESICAATGTCMTALNCYKTTKGGGSSGGGCHDSTCM